MIDFRKACNNFGYRLTRQRQQILRSITDRPSSVLEIMQRLEVAKYQIDKVTVYRNLECFEKMGLVIRTQFADRSERFELATGPHHHHVICKNCGKIRDIPLDDKYLLRKVGQIPGFKITGHSLEFYGLCGQCQKL